MTNSQCPMNAQCPAPVPAPSFPSAGTLVPWVIFWLLVIGALLISTARAAEKEFALPSDWPAGTVLRYDLLRVKETVRAGQTNTSRVKTPLTIEVVERSKAGYRLAWSYGRSSVIEPKQLDESQQRLLNIADGLKLVLRTDEAGTPEELVNRVEVAGTYQKILGEIRAHLAAGGMAADKITQATAPVEALTQPERVPAIALKEPNIFFLVTGGAFVPGQPRAYEDQLPNPLTGRPLATRARTTLKELRATTHEAILEWSQEPKSPEPNLVLRDTASFVVDIRTGWPKRVVYERSLSAGGARRVERLEFSAAR